MASAASTPRHWLIIPAAGIGARMAAPLPKQYLKIHGKTILERTIRSMLDSNLFESILVGLHPNDNDFSSLPETVKRSVESFVGGAERVSTVINGLNALSGRASSEDWIWVHDAARPFVTPEEIQSLCESLASAGDGALLALPASDTIKLSDDSGISTIDRSKVWRAQTPQAFPFSLLRHALESALENQIDVTDESSAVEFLGKSPKLVAGLSSNIKVTQPEDFELAKHYVTSLERSSMSITEFPSFRIGSGFDVHAFEEGDFITLGGVQIKHTKAFKAHSDGDVLIHALCDALLGALALGDIGHHFPDTDDQWKGANSRDLLKAVVSLIKEKGYAVSNADLTIMAQAPKMAPHISTMCEYIAVDLGVAKEQVSVKATTTEKLGFTGREEGIASQATVLLVAVP